MHEPRLHRCVLNLDKQPANYADGERLGRCIQLQEPGPVRDLQSAHVHGWWLKHRLRGTLVYTTERHLHGASLRNHNNWSIRLSGRHFSDRHRLAFGDPHEGTTNNRPRNAHSIPGALATSLNSSGKSARNAMSIPRAIVGSAF